MGKVNHCTKCGCSITKPSWCSDCTNTYNKEYAKNNREKLRQHKTKWRLNNLETAYELSEAWRKKHVEKSRAQVRKYQLTRLNRVPPGTDLGAIEQFYKNCPPGMEVDHIIPIKHKDVSGLHNVFNLQYLTPTENKRKLNKWLK